MATNPGILTGLYLVYHVEDQKTWFFHSTSPASAKSHVVEEELHLDSKSRDGFFYQHTLQATLVKRD